MDEFMKRKEEYEEKISSSDEGTNAYIALMTVLKSKTLRHVVYNPQTIQEVIIADGIVSIVMDLDDIYLKSKSADTEDCDYDTSTIVEYLNKLMIDIMNIKKGWTYSNDDLAVLLYEGCKALIYDKIKLVGVDLVKKHPLTVAKFTAKSIGLQAISTIRNINNKNNGNINSGSNGNINNNDSADKSDRSSKELAHEQLAAFIDEHQEEIYEFLDSPDGEKCLTTFEEIVQIFHDLYQKEYGEKQTGYQYQRKLS